MRLSPERLRSRRPQSPERRWEQPCRQCPGATPCEGEAPGAPGCEVPPPAGAWRGWRVCELAAAARTPAGTRSAGAACLRLRGAFIPPVGSSSRQGPRSGEAAGHRAQGGDDDKTHPGSAGRRWDGRCRRLEVGRSGCSRSRWRLGERGSTAPAAGEKRRGCARADREAAAAGGGWCSWGNNTLRSPPFPGAGGLSAFDCEARASSPRRSPFPGWLHTKAAFQELSRNRIM